MKLWDFIEQHIFPLFGDIPAESLEFAQKIFWIFVSFAVVYFLVYLPFKGILCLMHKAKWKEKWLL